jgi:hypothetical protein
LLVRPGGGFFVWSRRKDNYWSADAIWGEHPISKKLIRSLAPINTDAPHKIFCRPVDIFMTVLSLPGIFSQAPLLLLETNHFLLSSCPPKMVAGVIGTLELVCGLN